MVIGIYQYRGYVVVSFKQFVFLVIWRSACACELDGGVPRAPKPSNTRNLSLSTDLGNLPQAAVCEEKL